MQTSAQGVSSGECGRSRYGHGRGVGEDGFCAAAFGRI